MKIAWNNKMYCTNLFRNYIFLHILHNIVRNGPKYFEGAMKEFRSLAPSRPPSYVYDYDTYSYDNPITLPNWFQKVNE